MCKYIKWFIVLTSLPLILLNLSCSSASSVEEVKELERAPDFTLRDLNENEVSLGRFKNKKNVLLVFGATWCPHCRNEVPELKEIYKIYNDEDIKLLYIDIQESKKKVASFVKEYSIPYTVLLDTSGDVANAYRVRGIPHQVIIDKGGFIYYQGPRPYGGLMPLLLELTEKEKGG